MRLKKVTTAALVAGALVALTPQLADAQAITSDPIQTVPGFQGCGGNQTVRDITATYTCANQRTFHFGALNRTVVAVSTLNPDGSASTTFRITGGNAPADVPLAIRAHSGISSSSGPLIDEKFGTIPKGTAGPITIAYRFDCGQVDVKAVFTANGVGTGRISGGFFCKPMVTDTTTTTPTTAPGTTTGSSVAPTSATPSSAQVSVAARAVGALPATGSGDSNAVPVGLVLLSTGAFMLWVAWLSRRVRA